MTFNLSIAGRLNVDYPQAHSRTYLRQTFWFHYTFLLISLNAQPTIFYFWCEEEQQSQQSVNASWCRSSTKEIKKSTQKIVPTKTTGRQPTLRNALMVGDSDIAGS